MSALDRWAAPAPDEGASASSSARAAGWQRWEAALERASERLNPILVKEARQALKSRQFQITFVLLLTFGWVWSLLGVALLSPGIYFAPGGRFMLVGYYLVLAAPLLIVVPFSAFRSLAAEREDGTFELLSITSLAARQIVTGKLGSALLQMLVYYSALAPCIAFTYLLRGVDVVTIGLVLSYTLLLSILLSAAGLMLATASQARHWQVVLSVLLLVGLLLVLVMFSVTMIQLIAAGETAGYRDPDFWIGHLAVLSFWGSFLAMFVLAAAAQISFASDNRSTRLRVAMLVQQGLWVGWMTYVWIRVESEFLLYLMVAIAGAYWFVMGSLLTGEIAQLSPRVKRSLPQSFLGRMAFTWFNPGSGTGYTFAITNLLSVMLVAAWLGMAGQIVGFAGAPSDFGWLLFGFLVVAYVAAYLGAGRLLLLLFRQLTAAGLLLSILVHTLLVAIGAAFPAFLQAWLQGYSNLQYTSLQVSNWIWTLVEAADSNLLAHPQVLFAVFLGAAGLFVLNLALAVVEVEQVREATPQRIVQDELELHPERLSSPPRPKSPWDDEFFARPDKPR